MSHEEYEALKKVLLEETEKSRKDPAYARELIAKSGIYNSDGTLNSRYKCTD